jgi:signal transduction histidine kinase
VSLRWRLLLVSLATLAVGLGVLLIIGNVLLDRTVAGVTTRLLHTRAQAQIASLEVTGKGVRTRQVANDVALDDRAWVLSEGHVIEYPARVEPVLDRAAIAFGRRQRAAEIAAPGSVQLLSEALDAPGTHHPVGAVVVGVSVVPFDQLKRKVLAGSLAIAVLILVAAGIAIRRALWGALVPVRQMTSHAEDWSAHDLDRRFDLGPPRDELTGLATTLDHLLERIAASRRHERRFASDVAHELRTPLSIIRGRAELALDKRANGSPDELRRALNAIAGQAEEMSVTVETLIAIARSEIDPQAGAVDLRAVATEFEGVDVVVHGTVPPAEGDREIVRRALAPLVDNARKHARARVAIELSWAAGRASLAVRDDGPGVDLTLGDAVFEPGRQGPNAPPGGAGLGLPLARRLARACGGDITIGPGPGGCFIVDLPAPGGA